MGEFTGERVIPGEVDADLLNEHLARYAFAARLARGKRVLDAGCGVGYGSARLAGNARSVVGLEIASDALEAAQQRYGSPRLAFVRGDCRAVPFSDGSFDLVVAFEVIEHLQNWERLLAESRRVLAGWGELIVSTPNRLYYAETRQTPNPFHVHEFDYGEFRAALAEHFPHVRVFLENHTNGVVFSTPESRSIETAIECWSAAPEESHFFVAVCSTRPLHGSPAFVYLPQTANVLREREHHISLLERWLEQAKESLDQLHREHQSLEREAADDRKRAQEMIDHMERENAEKTEWNRQTAAELDRVKVVLESLQAAFEERTQWALQLETERAELDAQCKRLIEEAEKVRTDLKTCVDQLHATEEELERRTEWAQNLGREVAELTARIEALTADMMAIVRSPAYRIGKRLGLAPRLEKKDGGGGS